MNAAHTQTPSPTVSVPPRRSARQIGIGLRLAAGFGLMGLLIAGLGAFSAWRLQALSDEFADVLDSRVPRLELMQGVLDELNRLAIAARDGVSASGDEVGPLIARIDQERKAVGSKVQTLEEAFKGDGEAGAKTAEEFATHGSGVLVSLVKFTRALAAGNREAAQQTLKTSIQPRLDGMMAAVEGYRTAQMSALQQGKRDVQASTRSALFAIAAMVVGALVAAAAGSVVLGRSITRPLRSAVEAGEAIAAGDLRTRPPLRVRHEAGLVSGALDQITAQVGDMVRSIHTASRRLDASARDIVGGSHALSSHSATLSDRLEVSASAIGEIRSMVEASAAGASQVDARAREASARANDGKREVDEVRQGMRELAEQARRIAEIIGVIDGIAFQTNILALNAAVEAARAGEQGRGFAVVASEVRSLANRTTGSSAEIRKLIDASVSQVVRNVDRIEAVGTKMEHILGDVDDVSRSVATISEALATQLARIGDTDRTMVELREANGRTGSMIDELERMSQALDETARDLTGRVSVFRLDGATAA